MPIDYVRIYQLEDAMSITGETVEFPFYESIEFHMKKYTDAN